MANLAIKGHPTRGKEVIEILKMLGGKIRRDRLAGNELFSWYYINGNGYIDYKHYSLFNDTTVFTLEQFEEKFPYKLGDKVTHNLGILMNVVHICWDAECNVIRYDIQSPVDNNYKFKAMLAEHLQPYKEETIETITIDDFKANTKEWLIDKLHDMIISDAVKTISNIHDELHKPKYPKTYKDCCDVLSLNTMDNDAQGYEADLIIRFQEVLIARDAYWKIFGEQMGLGEPWEPDWLNDEQDKYVLFTHNNAICSNRYVFGHNILAFPTEEMRDNFYENFIHLINECKELL